ncbi:MAG: methyltransferase domain-containing protein [Acidimicrobiales bacterium]|nr:methyltransferase domain-containing protein [Acidimicrobiales bacterium]
MSATAPCVESGPVLRGDDGSEVRLDVAGWSAVADPVEQRLLATLDGPVLDLGCGPGRLVVALAERGVPALGIDASPVAVHQAVGRQASALVRSVFGPIPGTGRWTTALLMDGNVGIGGDPVRLLARTAELLAPHGRAVVEVSSPGTGSHRYRARIESGGSTSAWFPWARVSADDIAHLSHRAGLRLETTTSDGGRWFATLARAAR